MAGNKIFGKHLQSLREAKGYSQEQLAEMIGCTVQTVSNIENDRYKLPFERAYQLAEIFGVTPEYLLCKTDNKHYRGDVELAISKMHVIFYTKMTKKQRILCTKMVFPNEEKLCIKHKLFGGLRKLTEKAPKIRC